ncbi:MAG: hypothetical protein JSS51_03435 [Planctomycetes bacterium]|nr:hypothetical protein [Planctomycetota bacterium]
MSLVNDKGEVNWRKLCEDSDRRDEARHREHMDWLASDEAGKARILMRRLTEELDEHVKTYLCNFVENDGIPGKPMTVNDMLTLSDGLRGIYKRLAGVEFENTFMRMIAMRRARNGAPG